MSGNIRLYNSGGYVELQAPDNAASQTLILPTDSIQPALVHINTTEFSGVSNVSFNDVFTSAYDNYLINSAYTLSIATYMNYRLRLSGTDNTASSYLCQELEAYGSSTNGASQTRDRMRISIGNTDKALFSLDLYDPFKASHTVSMSAGGRINDQFQIVGRHAVSTAYDGITILPDSGTMTGSISVYGYRKS
jgi:hypothetical protein